MATYASPADLRAALGLDSAALSDAAADALLRDAEARIDSAFFAGRAASYADPETGRAWSATLLGTLEQFRRDYLRDATTTVARILRANPAAYDAPRAQSVSGPDFTETSVRRRRVQDDVGHLLRAAALVPSAARATA